MSDDSNQEKSEEPTAKRLEKAREEGQVPRSKELTTTAVLLGATISLYMMGGHLTQGLSAIFVESFTFDRQMAFDPSLMVNRLTVSLGEGLFLLIPLFIVLVLVAIAGPIALGGWLMSAKSLAPKFDRLNPIAGIKRMFSAKSLMELAKAIGKVSVIMVVAVLLLKNQQSNIVHLADLSIRQSLVEALSIMGMAAILLSASTIVIAAIDIPFQIWETTRKLKMSLQEIKDEMKDSEGKPEVKGRIRQLQREMANNRMMSAVPEADVIITNPTHFSVALKYDPATMSTPLVVAKGIDHVALKIREIANAHEIVIVESPVLARAIYYTAEVDAEIPSGLYLAVAQVLAYIFQLRHYRPGQSERPRMPKNLPIPDDFYFDS